MSPPASFACLEKNSLALIHSRLLSGKTKFSAHLPMASTRHRASAYELLSNKSSTACIISCASVARISSSPARQSTLALSAMYEGLGGTEKYGNSDPNDR